MIRSRHAGNTSLAEAKTAATVATTANNDADAAQIKNQLAARMLLPENRE